MDLGRGLGTVISSFLESTAGDCATVSSPVPGTRKPLPGDLSHCRLTPPHAWNTRIEMHRELGGGVLSAVSGYRVRKPGAGRGR